MFDDGDADVRTQLAPGAEGRSGETGIFGNSQWVKCYIGSPGWWGWSMVLINDSLDWKARVHPGSA